MLKIKVVKTEIIVLFYLFPTYPLLGDAWPRLAMYVKRNNKVIALVLKLPRRNMHYIFSVRSDEKAWFLTKMPDNLSLPFPQKHISHINPRNP